MAGISAAKILLNSLYLASLILESEDNLACSNNLSTLMLEKQDKFKPGSTAWVECQ